MIQRGGNGVVRPETTGPLLGFEELHGGARVLGAAAYNMYKLFSEPDEKKLIIEIQEHYVAHLAREMATSDGIALQGETIAAANHKASGVARPQILPGNEPSDRTQLVSINTAFLHDLERVPAFQGAPTKEFSDTGSADGKFSGTIAQLIIAVRAGRCGVVIREKDTFESEKQNMTVIRNKVDGFRSIDDLVRYGIVAASDLNQYRQWLRI